jgi:hypothetical protein
VPSRRSCKSSLPQLFLNLYGPLDFGTELVSQFTDPSDVEQFFWKNEIRGTTVDPHLALIKNDLFGVLAELSSHLLKSGCMFLQLCVNGGNVLREIRFLGRKRVCLILIFTTHP